LFDDDTTVTARQRFSWSASDLPRVNNAGEQPLMQRFHKRGDEKQAVVL
jgi:hypothetical protein